MKSDATELPQYPTIGRLYVNLNLIKHEAIEVVVYNVSIEVTEAAYRARFGAPPHEVDFGLFDHLRESSDPNILGRIRRQLAKRETEDEASEVRYARAEDWSQEGLAYGPRSRAKALVLAYIEEFVDEFANSYLAENE